MQIPRDFPKWDKQVDGLEDAGRWALEFERSRLPAQLIVPRTGQIWETIQDCVANFRAYIEIPRPQLIQGIRQVKSPHWFKPVDFKPCIRQFGTTVLRRGERIRILELAEPKPINISFVPVRYHELHESIVPAEIRELSSYHGGYELSVKIARTISDFHKDARQSYFNEAFHLIEDAS